MRVAVVGAGLGGLSAAIRLAAAGHSVDVFEKNERIGGKLNLLERGGYTFDTGPTLLTMPFVLDDLFASVGARREDHLEIVPLDPTCRYFFADGSRLDTSNDLEETERAMSTLAPADAGAFTRFHAHARRIYDAASGPFMYSGFGSWSAGDVVRSLRHLPALPRLDAGRTMQQAINAHFTDPRLRQLFGRFATYNGSSPFRAPATLAIIPYVEFAFGGWYVRGGLYAIARVLARLAERTGVRLHTHAAVQRITTDGRRIRGVELEDGRGVDADIVISNADADHTMRTLLRDTAGIPHQKYERLEPSLAGVILYLGVRRSFPQLAQHNIFFSADYEKEFAHLFDEGVPADEPTIYVSASCLADPTHAPAEGMNLFVLVNAPPLNGKTDWRHAGAAYRDSIVRMLEERGLEGLSQAIDVEELVTPDLFEARTNALRGSIYGSSSNNRFAAFLRPPNRSRYVRGLYFAGGTAHPGGGIPMVLLSGTITADLIQRDHA